MRFTQLAMLAGLSLSCGVLPVRTPAPTGAGLPHVAAPPPRSADAGAAQRDAAIAALVREFEARHTGLSQREIRELAPVLIEESLRHGIELDLVLAVMHVESRCYNFAVSPVGALGLMQIMPGTGELGARKLGLDWRGPRTLFDPAANVRIGVWYLRELRDRYGRIDVALAAYNWGPGRIDGFLRNGQALPTLYPSQVREAQQGRGTAAGRGRV